MQHCGPECSYCAREFWRWLKNREFNMSRALPGTPVSFTAAAKTSVKPAPEREESQAAFSSLCGRCGKQWKVFWAINPE